jgi:two-component system cell cycle sensor histidine kinase/response regulator CckA
VSKVLLVVDDEHEILDLIDEDLTGQGYRVLIADRGEAAVEKFRATFPRPDLVLVDVVMPGISGPMVVDRLREIESDVPVLFMSGFHDRQVVQRYVTEQGFRMILKPFTLADLREAVNQSLQTLRKPIVEKFVH